MYIYIPAPVSFLYIFLSFSTYIHISCVYTHDIVYIHYIYTMCDVITYIHIQYRNEAVRELFGSADAPETINPGRVIQMWCRLVDFGSRAAVAASKII